MNQRAFAAVALGAIITGFSGILIKNMTIPATSMAFIRTAIPAFSMAAYVLWSGQSFLSRSFKFYITVSLLNVARMYFFFLAYIYTSIGNAVIMLYTWPIFAAVFGTIFLHEKISSRQAGLLVASFIGLIIVQLDKDFSCGGSDLIGISAALGCAILFALMMIYFKKKSAEYSLQEMILYQNFVPALIFLPFFLWNPFPTSLDWTLAGTNGIMVGVVAYHLFFCGLRYLKASTHAMIMYLEIVSAVGSSILILGEVLSLNTIIGAVIIILSTLMLRLK